MGREQLFRMFLVLLGMQLKTVCKESTVCVLIKTLIQSMFLGSFAANQKASYKEEEGFLQRMLSLYACFGSLP